MNSISVLAPIKINNKQQFQIFSRCLNSYIDLMRFDKTEIIVSNESIGEFKGLVHNKFLEVNNETKFINEKGFVNSIRSLINKSKNKYIVFFLDDVEIFLKGKDFQDSIEVMDKNDDVIQIKFGGGKVYKANQKQKSEYKRTHTPIEVGDNIVWLNDSSEEDSTYVISQWNSIIRSDFLKKLDTEYDGSSQTWDSYSLQISKIFINNGFNSNTKTGWLNLSCGLYAWGRTNNSLEKHKELYDKDNRR